MRIEYDIKLGFKDVMFRPKRSTLKQQVAGKTRTHFQAEAYQYRMDRNSGNGCQYGYGWHFRNGTGIV